MTTLTTAQNSNDSPALPTQAANYLTFWSIALRGCTTAQQTHCDVHSIYREAEELAFNRASLLAVFRAQVAIAPVETTASPAQTD